MKKNYDWQIMTKAYEEGDVVNRLDKRPVQVVFTMEVPRSHWKENFIIYFSSKDAEHFNFDQP